MPVASNSSSEMSARVLNPQFMSDMRRTFRDSPPGGERERVRRNLFGVTQEEQEENRKIVKQKLEEQAEKSKLEWEYDFVNDQPLNIPGGRFKYTAVTTETPVPRAYELRHLSTAAATPARHEPATPDEASPPKEEEASPSSTSSAEGELLDGPATSQQGGSTGSNTARQSRMTDFLKTRKRPGPKQSTTSEPPLVKQSRTQRS